MSTIPKVISGSSLLGNLYQELPYEKKLAMVKAYIDATTDGMPMFDTAGKYGAGLALETLGQALNDLDIDPDKVIISNKLAWVRKPLTTPEPTFEPGIWKGLKYDAEQKISYDGIIECFENGNELLGKYNSQFASVHDPDEYLSAAADEADAQQRYDDILGAYRALFDLKKDGKIAAVGVGSKDWTAIQRIVQDVKLDWVMLANSYTVHSHPSTLAAFIQELNDNGTIVINSAVFNGGFLVGSEFYNYRPMSRDNAEQAPFFAWRDAFHALCKQFDITPAAACIYFGLQVPGITSIALNSSSPDRVQKNVDMANATVPKAFWDAMKEQGLLETDYAFV